MNGTPFDLNSLQEKWTFVFFGYTHCPDICPTTLATLKGTAMQLQQSPEDYRDARFVFISVDPKRDALAHLKEYIGYFHPDFLAATGDRAQIDALVRQLGAIYMFDGDTAGDDYIVNHSASIALIDPQGNWVGRFNPPHRAAGIAEDFRRVRHFLLND
jgi:protein SCO1/2